MKRKWKIVLAALVVVLVAGGLYASVQYNKRGLVTVQTGRAVRQDLASVVTASGEIKPRNYINISADVQGRITALLVKEGDRVRRGQVLARLESVQAQAEVQAQRAAVNSAEADSAAAEANVTAADANIANAQATLDRTRADYEKARIDFQRTQELVNAKLIAQQDYDNKKATLDAQAAAIREAETKITQLKAQKQQQLANLTSFQRRIAQNRATLRRSSDILEKYNSVSPIDGVVTNLPVRVGETVVPGIQNSAASTIMTIADTSVITGEVKVDETDIINVKLGQPAEVTVDAIQGQTFKGRVIEIGDTAILRSTGVAASQSQTSSQEAKDFKVVIALDNPSDVLRPGLSCTGRITTATRGHALTVPIQALQIRQRGDLEPPKKGDSGTVAAAAPDPATAKARKEELQGVFVVNNGKAVFRPVKTGITGATDTEVTDGVREGDEVITGSYKVLRTLRNDAKVKVDNKQPEKKET